MTKKQQYVNGKPVYNPWSDYGAKTPGWLLRREDVSHGAKHAYARLVQYAGKNGVAYPYVQTLATEIGVKRRAAERYLKELREMGLIEIQSGRATGDRNRYFFVNHEWKTEAAMEVNLDAGLTQEGATDQTDPPDLEASNETEGVRQNGRRGSVISDGLNVIHGKNSEKEIISLGVAVAPPEKGPKPKQETLAPGLGSYSEKAAREPDAEHEFDPANGHASLEGIKAGLAEKKQKKAAAQLAKQRKSEQAQANLASDGRGLTPEERKSVKSIENLWAEEMGKAFTDLAIAPWDAKQRGQTRNLITKYDGLSIEAAVKYVVRRWDEFNKQAFQGNGRLPSMGLILKLHETIVPVAVKWEKHADTMEKWEKFYAEHPYDDPPAELEKKYRAAKASLNALGLA